MREKDFKNWFYLSSIVGFIFSGICLGVLGLLIKFIFFSPIITIKYLGELNVFKIFIIIIVFAALIGTLFSIKDFIKKRVKKIFKN